MVLTAGLSLAFSQTGDKALLDLAKTLLSKNPQAYLVETSLDRLQGRYTFLNNEAKPMATWEEPTGVIRMVLDTSKQTLVWQRVDKSKSSITLLNSSRIVYKMESPMGTAIKMAGSSVLVFGFGRPVDRITKPELNSAWVYEPWSDTKVTGVETGNSGSIWAILEWPNKEEAYNKIVRLDAEGRLASTPDSFGHRFLNWVKFIPNTNMMVFENGEGKTVFVDTKTNSKKEFPSYQVRPFVWLPKLKAVAYMARDTGNEYGRSTFGLFYPATGENKLVPTGGKFILSYVGIDGDKLLMLTNNDNPSGGGAQAAAPPNTPRIPVPGEIGLLDPLTGKTKIVGKVTDSYFSDLQSCSE